MNDDTISRQAAIDVADAVWSVTGDKNVAKVWDQIKDLPSAQPDTRSLEQIKWERDIAIQQLKDLGYDLGEKIRTDGDTISRQAIINSFRYDDDGTAWDMDDIVYRLEQFPSAQSDLSSYSDKLWRNAYERGRAEAQAEIVKCKDCKWKQGSECTRFAEVRPFPDDFCSRAERQEE